MYWTSEDIQPSVDLAEKLFGKSGIYSSNEDTTHSNVFILTREFGKLWQGRLDLNKESKNKIEMLADTINKRVYLINEFDYKNPLYVTMTKLRRMEEHSF